MRTIDLKSIIQNNKLDVNEVAHQLFPKNKHARLALNRVMDEKAVLDADQISKLALILGVPISNLYSGREWKSKNKKGIIVFTSENYRAELDTETWITKIFDNDSLFHESIIHSGSIPLSEFINKLNNQIEQHGNIKN